MKKILGAVFVLGLAAISHYGCGADSDDGGFGNGPDAGAGGSDGGVANCRLDFVPPSQVVLGQPSQLEVLVERNAFGALNLEWTIELNGVPQEITELSESRERVAFTPVVAGVYQIVVEGQVSSIDCSPALGTVGVRAPGALVTEYRMRVVPADDAPMQDLSVEIYGGADAVLPEIVVDAGEAITGRLTTATGTGVSAYVRARLRGAVVRSDYETFSDASGEWRLTLPDGRFDLLVVPEGGEASQEFSDVGRDELAGERPLAAVAEVNGFVLASDGSGLAGARVSILADGAHSSEATSAKDGSFRVFVRGSEFTGVSVTPPPESGLPVLRADSLAGGPLEGAPIEIRYAGAPRSVALDVTTAGGSPAAGARLEWRGAVASAGTVSLGGPLIPVAGTLRAIADADASGHVERLVPSGTSSLVVVAGDGQEARLLRDVDWQNAPLSAVALEPLARTPVVVQAEGSPASGARVRAIPRGVLAPQSEHGDAQTEISDAEPSQSEAALSLIRDGHYELLVQHPEYGRHFSDLPSAQATPVGPLVLPGTLLAEGRLVSDGDGASMAGAQVRLFCSECTGPLAERVHASATTDATGRFQLRVADPGVAAED